MLKILSIGNSFSQDAQRYLTRFAKAAGVDILTHNLEIGGCSLEQHWNYFKNDDKNYALEIDGVWKANEYTLTQGLMEDDMEEYYITYQSTDFELVMRRKQKKEE